MSRWPDWVLWALIWAGIIALVVVVVVSPS
jgi:hypothetical protein